MLVKQSSQLIIFLLSSVLITTPANGGIFSDIWGGVQSVVSAPFRAVGWVVGPGISTAVDPALDNAFGRLKSATEHASSKFDQISKERLTEFDTIAKQRIEQVDKVLEGRLDQTDKILDSKLNKLEEVGFHLLDREAKILDENVTRVEDILDQSLDRLQEIETDAFNRVDAALQDQVPFAASQVARTLEWTAAVIVFIVVLVGFGGVDLLRRIRSDSSSKSIWSKLFSNLVYVPKTLLLVGVPMLFFFAIIQIGYLTYCNRADVARITRLEDASKLLELAGDFKSATELRRRALALDGEGKRHYMVMRDMWLAAFWQKHIGQDSVELSQRFSYLQAEPAFANYFNSDAELQAAGIYIRSNYKVQSPKSNLSEEIQRYKLTFVTNSKEKPVLGKLVYMAEAKLTLNDTTKSIKERFDLALNIVTELLSIEDYKRYASGLVLRSQLAAYMLELKTNVLESVTDQTIIDTARIQIKADVETAFAADPNLARYIRFKSNPLPSVLTADLKTWIDRASLPDDTARALLSEKITEQFKEYATELEQIIKPLIGIDLLPKAKVERQLMYSMKATFGEDKLEAAIKQARKDRSDGKSPTLLLSSYKAIVATAIGIGKLHLAEVWLEASLAQINKTPTAPLVDSEPDGKKLSSETENTEKQLEEVQKTAGYPSLDPNLNPIPQLTDIMFYVF